VSEMMMTIATNKVGSACTYGMGYTEEEWKAMDEDEQGEILTEFVWQHIDVSVSPEE